MKNAPSFLFVLTFSFVLFSCGNGLRVVEFEKELSFSNQQSIVFQHRQDSISKLNLSTSKQRTPSEIIEYKISIIQDVLSKRQIKKGKRLGRKIKNHG